MSGGAGGGGVENLGVLTVTNSTFTANSQQPLDGSGGGGGAILSNGTLIIGNSVFTGNSAERGTG